MSVIIVFIGSFLLYANPDLRQDTYRTEMGITGVRNSITSGSESINEGYVFGWGASLLGEYREETPIRHTLGMQRYESNNWTLEFYSLGLDYVYQWPKLPVQIALGAEIGSVQMLPKGLSTIKAGTDKLGWEFHGEALHFFLLQNQLVHAFVRPAWRVYQPELEAGGVSKKLNAGGLSISGGLGIQF